MDEEVAGGVTFVLFIWLVIVFIATAINTAIHVNACTGGMLKTFIHAFTYALALYLAGIAVIIVMALIAVAIIAVLAR